MPYIIGAPLASSALAQMLVVDDDIGAFLRALVLGDDIGGL